jgi:hypothetical protein
MAEDRRVSRRELLRTIGMAGAAAWATPVLTSTRASAGLDRCRKKKARSLCNGARCWNICTNGGCLCGTCSSDVGDGSYCFARYGDLKCFCAEDVFCSEAGTCSSDLDCKDQNLGNVCITMNGCTGCGSSTGICSTRCCRPQWIAPAAAIAPRRLGRTAAGQRSPASACRPI